MSNVRPKLKLLPFHQYRGVKPSDPLKFYYWPFIGRLYRKRVELCLAECPGGQRVLEVGFGSGATFLNLSDIYKEIYGLDLDASIHSVDDLFKNLGVCVRLTNGNVLSMPYSDDFFDTILLISILEHLKPAQQIEAFRELRRVLKPQGSVVYGVPVERPLMVWAFKLMGYNIRDHHFSTEKDVYEAAKNVFTERRMVSMPCIFSALGDMYEIGHFVKT